MWNHTYKMVCYVICEYEWKYAFEHCIHEYDLLVNMKTFDICVKCIKLWNMHYYENLLLCDTCANIFEIYLKAYVGSNGIMLSLTGPSCSLYPNRYMNYRYLKKIVTMALLS